MKAFVANLILTIVLLVGTVTAIFFFNRAAAPQEKILPTEGALTPDYERILSTVGEPSLRKDLERLCGMASRFSGSPGGDQAAAIIEENLRSLGYEIVEQPFSLAVPQTQHARLLDEQGRELEGIRISPMLPNWFRTATTPVGGLTGTVYAAERGLAREFSDVDLRGNFVLLPLGISWSTVVGMGADAVLYYDDGRKTVGANWDHHKNASLNIPRFVVTGDALSLKGKTVTLDTRVDFVEAPARNIIGLLRVPGAEEALVLNSYYDSYSYAPDLAPGAMQACSPAVLLACARQLAAERDALKRSVFVVATVGHGQGAVGIREFVRSLGVRDEQEAALARATEARELAEQQLTLAEAALVITRDPTYWTATNRAAEATYWESRDETTREYFTELFKHGLDNTFMAAVETLSQRRVDWVRDGMTVRDKSGTETPSFAAYSQARERQSQVQGMVATPLGALKGRFHAFFENERFAMVLEAACTARTEKLRARREEAQSREHLARELGAYKRLLVLGIDVTPAGGRIGLVCGDATVASQCMPADAEIMAQITAAGSALDKIAEEPAYTKDRKKLPVAVNLLREKDLNSLTFAASFLGPGVVFESTAALHAGHCAFTIATVGDSRLWMGTPLDTLDKIVDPELPEDMPEGYRTPLQHLTVIAHLITATASQFALGHGQIVPVSLAGSLHTIPGRVVSQMGDNLTPDYCMPGAVVRFGPLKRWSTPTKPVPGMGVDFYVVADWNGEFAMHSVWPSLLSSGYQSPIDMDAALLRPEDGEILWTLSMLDSGPTRPYSVMGIRLAQYDKSLAMPVLFRAKPLQVVPMPDPATFRPYAGFDFIDAKGLAKPQKFKVESDSGTYVCFVPPETRLFFTFKKGSLSNPNLTKIRAFALGAQGAPDGSETDPDKEITGEGYLAADAAKIINIELDAALSMTQVNSKRIAIQQRYNMADDMVVAYNQTAISLVNDMREAVENGDTVRAKHLASDSVAYSSNIHPVIRKNASDAIVGILFYLLLAVPFAIFMEKLLVGHPDLRVQISIQGVIFLVFFLMLKAVHPAYQLVRSSYMILLGFITFALSAMVSSFLASRFSSNIGELQRKIQDRTEVADVSRAGAAMTAFLLGLGHMRKRPVRTGLTVGTLILTTFVMLCFTSINTDVVDVEFPVSKAPYTGLFVRDRSLATIQAALNPLRELYGKDHIVVERAWGGKFTAARGEAVERAEYLLSHDVEDRSFETQADAILGLSHLEPYVMPVTNAFDVLTRWFETDTEFSCFLPRALADELYIRDADVENGEANITIGTRQYEVLGIFDGDRLGAVLDLDGQSMLPLDVLGLLKPGQQQGGGDSEAMDVPEDIARLPGDAVIITPTEAMPARTSVASVAVAFRGLDYAAARELITSHLERSAQPGYYGVDGIGFYGGKFRMRSVEGLLDLLLPIIIAAMTVLNTMRGSVYERRDELYVFNAVGLSPSHIRALFLAEASVYAVVGAVGGYLLAQGIGTGLRVFGLTAGLTMNYSSLSSVFVSIVIMAVVFVSSIFPARMAAQLAAPAELMTRERKTSEGDIIEIDLPFTFNRRDRLAIVPYFVDWFENYGEGSSGEYFCSIPECGVLAEDHGGAAPFVETTTWLKPYDLGVSQRVALVVRHLPDTGDNVAVVAMTRLSGDRESWERCCHAFIGLLRKRFLTWRAVPDDARERLFERGKNLLEKTLKT